MNTFCEQTKKNLTEKSIVESISNRLKNNVERLIELQNLSNDELKRSLLNSERFDEVSAIPSLNNPTRKDTRIVFLTVAAILDLINQKD
jgi:hypothetical protein